MSDPIVINLVELTSEVVAAYVTRNYIQPNELPGLIASVHTALGIMGKPTAPTEEPVKPVPPVSIRKSITDEYLVSLEDGKRYKSLKRHLAKHGLTPAEYRAKWGLSQDGCAGLRGEAVGIGEEPGPRAQGVPLTGMNCAAMAAGVTWEGLGALMPVVVRNRASVPVSSALSP